MNTLISICSLVLFELALVAAKYCPYQECFCTSAQIICITGNLKNIPRLTGANVTGYPSLFLDSNNITKVEAGILPLDLTELSFSHNPITTIEDNAFDGLQDSLETLSFSDAVFNRIPDAFLHLNTLKSLSISDTSIKDWNFGVMEKICGTLETLYLQNVGLTAWPTWLQNCTSMKDLRIVGSSMSFIPDDAFDPLADNLTTLSISNSSLTSIPKALSKLKVLRTLNVQHSNVSDLSWLPYLSNLTYLSLSNNNMANVSHLSNVLFSFAGSLSNLDLSENKLEAIPELSQLIHLEDVNFNNNIMSDVISGSLPSGIHSLQLKFNSFPSIPRALVTLNISAELIISWNAIKTIRGSYFPKSIQMVYLANNLITELTDDSFPVNSSILVVDLSYNPLTAVSPLAFANMLHLRELHFQNTRLTRLPLALSSIPQLSWFDISGVPGLVCTCLEKSLESFFRKLDTLEGTCGEISVHDFFEMLSPSCSS